MRAYFSEIWLCLTCSFYVKLITYFFIVMSKKIARLKIKEIYSFCLSVFSRLSKTDQGQTDVLCFCKLQKSGIVRKHFLDLSSGVQPPPMP